MQEEGQADDSLRKRKPVDRYQSEPFYRRKKTRNPKPRKRQKINSSNNIQQPQRANPQPASAITSLQAPLAGMMVNLGALASGDFAGDAGIPSVTTEVIKVLPVLALADVLARHMQEAPQHHQPSQQQSAPSQAVAQQLLSPAQLLQLLALQNPSSPTITNSQTNLIDSSAPPNRQRRRGSR